MKPVIVFFMVLSISNISYSMDVQNPVLEQLFQRVIQTINRGGNLNDLTQDEQETIEWLAWDGNPTACTIITTYNEDHE